jgi:hypothetical protein
MAPTQEADEIKLCECHVTVVCRSYRALTSAVETFVIAFLDGNI